MCHRRHRLIARVKSPNDDLLPEAHLPREDSLPFSRQPRGIGQRVNKVRRSPSANPLLQSGKPAAIHGHHSPTFVCEFSRCPTVRGPMPTTEDENGGSEGAQLLPQGFKIPIRVPLEAIRHPVELIFIEWRIALGCSVADEELNSIAPSQFLQAGVQITG